MDYKNYRLDKELYELTDREIMIVDNFIMMVENHLSLRQLAKEVCRSKSQLHRDVIELFFSDELYKLVREQFNFNIQHVKEK